MRVVSGSQGTAEWHASRRGKISASRIKDVMNILKNGAEGSGRRRYRNELAIERLTGRTANHYVTSAMEHGNEYEPIARAAYEVERNVMVESVGFVLHPTLDYSGASPDGILADRAIEIKAPQEDTFVNWIQDGLVVPEDHHAQCYWVMECCEFDLLDFIGYRPGMKPLIIPFPRDDKKILEIRSAVERFQEDVEATVEKLRDWVIPETASQDQRQYESAPPIDQWVSAFEDFMPGDISQ